MAININPFKKKKAIAIKLSNSTIQMARFFESQLGIPNEELIQRLYQHVNDRASIYKMGHLSESPNLVIKAQIFRLAGQCRQLTSDNADKLLNLFIQGTKEENWIDIYMDDLMSYSEEKADLFPKYPTEQINSLMEAWDLAGAYSNKVHSSKSILWRRAITIEFYANWDELLQLSDEEASGWWNHKLQMLIDMTEDENKQTVCNVLSRKYPNAELTTV